VGQINRLCIVEGHDYGNEIANIARGHPPFQWKMFRSGDERGKVNVIHAGTDPKLKGRYNVRVWDCAPRDFRQCLASGVDQINCDRDQVALLKEVIRDQSPTGRSPTLDIQGSQILLAWQAPVSNVLYVALGSAEKTQLNFPREIALTHLLPDDCLAVSPSGALISDDSPKGRLIVVYEGLSDHGGVRQFWHTLLQRLPWRLARLLRRPQSLRYVAGRFTSLERFVTFDGREHRLASVSGSILHGRDPSVAVGLDGRILIVFEASDGRGIRYFSGSINSEGELVGQDFPLIENEVCPGYTPAIAVDATGRVIVIYQGVRGQELWYVSGCLDPTGRIVGRRFSFSQGDIRRGRAPAIALDENGRVIVVYQDAQDEKIWCASGTLGESGRIHGTTFPLSEGPEKAEQPTVTFDQKGDVLVLYPDLDTHRLCYVQGPIQSGHLVSEKRFLRVGLEQR
jgi:hypothetical protein